MLEKFKLKLKFSKDWNFREKISDERVNSPQSARRDSNPRHLASESADGITFAADGKATVTVEQFELNL